MTRPVIIRPEAKQDIAEGYDWYEGRQEGLGAEFLTAVNELFAQIRETPELYAPEFKAVRRASLDRFPYVIYYRIDGESLEVIAVLHGGRNPRRWRSRA
jgi:toxin ParE1/3/4